MKIISTIITLSVFVVAVAVSHATALQESRVQEATSEAPTVLFICPHGAAKSVLASAYFQRIAKERGLDVQVRSAGTDPEAAVSPTVASHLQKNGYDVPVATPRRATAEDMASTDLVISIGCDLKDLPSPRGTLVKWDDVPSTTDQFTRADERIRERVIALIDELVRDKQYR